MWCVWNWVPRYVTLQEGEAGLAEGGLGHGDAQEPPKKMGETGKKKRGRAEPHPQHLPSGALRGGGRGRPRPLRPAPPLLSAPARRPGSSSLLPPAVT